MAIRNLALSIGLTSLPSLAWTFLIHLAQDGEYFWIVYRLVSVLFLLASLILGGGLPALFPKAWARRPGLWLATQMLLAWGCALAALGLLNLTPLCVGQDNGDGSNDLALCVVQSALVGFIYSFPQAAMMLAIAVPAGWLLRRTAR